MKLILPILLLLLCNYSHAQKSKWNKVIDDPNIVWVADFEQDYCFLPMEKHNWLPSSPYYHQFFEQTNQIETDDTLSDIYYWNRLNLRKIPVPPQNNGFSVEYGSLHDFWSDLIKTQLREEGKTGFHDPYLHHRLNDSTARILINYYVDTTYYFDEESLTDKVKIIAEEIPYSNILGIRALHRAYLDKKTNLIGLEVISWTPLLHLPYWEKPDVQQPTIWFKPKKSKTKDSKLIKSSNITWAFETQSLNNVPLFDSLKVVKGKLDALAYVLDLIKNHRKKLASTSGYKIISYESIIDELTLPRHDTISVIDPDTYEENLEFNISPPINKIEHLRFVIRWYWDDKKKMLLYRNVGYAPIATRVDDEGEAKFSMPLFYVPIK